VLSVLCVHNTAYPLIARFRVLFSVLVSILLSVFCALAVWCAVSGKQTLSKTAVSVYLFLLFCLLLIYIFQKTGFFALVKDETAFREYLQTKGKWMPVLYIVLQYLQVVILPIPSVVSTLAGVALFGAFKTIVYSLIGIILGSITAFFIGRKLGNKAVSWMIGQEELNKWQKRLKGKDNFILTVMFLLPMFPDDVLCFIAGLSSMSNKYFLIMIVLSRIVSVSTTCYSINFIPFNTWWGLLIWGVLFALIIVSFIWIYKNLDKLQNKFQQKFKKK
jgi:uncharacterized membrane protein YdjX (TVP38/TMEM64 family)